MASEPKRHQRSGVVFRNVDGGPFYHTWLDQQRAAVRAAHFWNTLASSGAGAFTIMKLMGQAS